MGKKSAKTSTASAAAAAVTPEAAVTKPKADKKASKKSNVTVAPVVAAVTSEETTTSKSKATKKSSKKSKADAVPDVASATPEEAAMTKLKTNMKSKKSKAAVPPAATAAAPVSVTPTPVSNALADMFAQSSVLFAKKASYVQPEVATTDAASSKRKRAASTDGADKSSSAGAETSKTAKAKKAAVPARSLEDDEVDEEEAAADAAERSLVLPEKKQKKKKHKTLAREAAEAAAAAAAANGENATASDEASAVSASNATDDDKTARTVFVGNVSLDATQKDLKTFFSQCGKVESVRLRSMPIAGCAVDQAGNQKLMMKVCANKKILLDSKDHCNAYVTFADTASVAKALALNGATFMLLAIRVDHENPVVDPKRSVFVGNVGFNVSDEVVRKFFVKRLKSDDEPSPVQNVRIIRDRTTGAGKGFGYVLLQSAALAAKALALHESKLEGRPIRVQVCGKRFKNKKGEDDDKKKKHEGVRASVGAKARVALKRKAGGTVKGAVPAKVAAGKLAGVASSAKKLKPKHAARKALQAADGSGAKKVFKKPSGAGAGASKSKKPFSGGKKSERAPKPKVKKPKHAARKARQAAEAAAAAK